MNVIHSISTTQASSLLTLRQRFAASILTVMADQRVSTSELARRLGVPPEAAAQILSSTCEELSLATLARIGEVLHVEWEIETTPQVTRFVKRDDSTPEDAA